MAKSFKAEYTAEDVLGLYEQRSTDQDETRIRNVIKEMRALTRMENKINIPDEYKDIAEPVHTPYIRDNWQRITGSLLSKQPLAHITPKDDKREEYRKSANVAERFDMAMIERLSKQLGLDITVESTRQHVRDGESVIKVVHKPDAWDNFPERADESADDYKDKVEEYKQGVDLPIAWDVPDRLSIVSEDGRYGDAWVIEYGEYDIPYLKNRYGMVQVSDDRSARLVNPKSTLTGRPMPEGLGSSANGKRRVKIEFFTSREWHVIIDGTEAPGFPKKNPYAPYIPYFKAPAMDSESLLYSLLFLGPRLDDLLTMKLNWAYLTAWANPVIEQDLTGNSFPGLGEFPATMQGPNGVITWKPGKTMQLPPGWHIKFLEAPAGGKDLNDLVIIFKQLIDVAGIPSVMRGAGSMSSGYEANQMLAAAQMMYKQSVLALQRQLEKATEFSHWLVSNVIKQTVYVLGWEEVNPKTGKPTSNASQGWLGLSPDSSGKNIANLKFLGPINFQFRPTLPTDEQARAMIAMQLTNAQVPLMDVRTAIERYLQEEDPETIIDAMAVDAALKEEPFASMIRDAALREAGISKPPPPAPSGLLDQFGQPMMPPGPGQIQPGVPGGNGQVSGQPSVPGINMPLVQATPPPPQGVMGNNGASPGSYPGQPSGQGR